MEYKTEEHRRKAGKIASTPNGYKSGNERFTNGLNKPNSVRLRSLPNFNTTSVRLVRSFGLFSSDEWVAVVIRYGKQI